MTFRPSTEDWQARRAAEKAANMSALMVPSQCAGVYGGTTAAPAPKESPVRSEAYRRLVAAMPCAICGIDGYSQAAHPNAGGKGMGLKTDDRGCFPLCSPRPGEVGCHAKFDQHALFTKEERRAFEVFAGRMTRILITKQGLWPSNLPCWEQTE